ncbi:MAG: 50S ribosomal protein L18 [Caedimonadaceae bacterium]|nr:MAG: 50S ribosomal protein L18 [Caedimonadaceae bacterium]
MLTLRDKFNRRTSRTRAKIAQVNTDRPRLSVYRSKKNIYVQIIDDTKRHTLVAASTLDRELKGQLKTGADKAAAEVVGKLIAKRAVENGIKTVVFDRGGYLFHGRVKALAEAARSNGLDF